jgi:hypothetical protein
MKHLCLDHRTLCLYSMDTSQCDPGRIERLIAKGKASMPWGGRLGSQAAEHAVAVCMQHGQGASHCSCQLPAATANCPGAWAMQTPAACR